MKRPLIKATHAYIRIRPKKYATVKPKKDENILWRDSAKDLIEKHTEAGLMLRGARYKADLTQKQLAEKLGLKPHHISEMEYGKRSIAKAMAKRFAEILDVDYRIFL